MVELSRRHVLVLGAVGLLVAGCAPVSPAHTAPPTPTPVGPPDWAGLASRITGALARPGRIRYLSPSGSGRSSAW